MIVPFDVRNASASQVFVVGSARVGASKNDAAKTYRFGLARAFQALGFSTRIVDGESLHNFVRAGQAGVDDVVIASASEIVHFPKALRHALRRTRMLAWVNFWFPGQRAFFRKHGFPDIGTNPQAARAVADCEPTALFTSNTECAFGFYENWIVEQGQLFSFPLAFDRIFYEATSSEPTAELNKAVVYVGGYWPYKGRMLRKYLMPFERQLVVYGYSEWPFGDYRAELPPEQEADILRSAAVVPGINEPHAELLGGDVCERVYKVAGLGGLCVADLCPGYRDLFAENELLMPRSYAEYLNLVRAILEGELEPEQLRRAGRQAVLERHLYEHRALAMLKACGLFAETMRPATATPLA